MPRYLVTSTSKTVGGVFLIDTRTAETRRLLTGCFRGLTRGPGDAYYAVRDPRNWEPEPFPEHRAWLYRITPGSWEARQIADHNVGDPHDLRWVGGHFYLVGSLGNQVARLDAEGQFLDRMQVVEDERDVCHLNCLTSAGNALYASLFTLSPGERQEKRLLGLWQNEGKVIRIDYPRSKFEVVCEPLGQPHSLVHHDGALYLTESHRAHVTRVDPATGAAHVVRTYYGFVRGLVFHGNEAVVGVSPFLRKERYRFKRSTFFRRMQEKYFPFCGLLVVNPRNWRVRRRITMEGCEPYEIFPLAEGE